MPDTPLSPPTLRPRRAKVWWRSKTLWFNALCAALGAAELGLGLLQPALPLNAYAVLSFVLAVGNAALRVTTRMPIELPTATPP